MGCVKLQLGLLAGLLAAMGLAVPACDNDRQARLERDVRALQDEMQELKRSRADHRARLEELSARMMLLQDRVESEEVASARVLRRQQSGLPEDLPVIRIGPSDAERSEGSYSVIRFAGSDARAEKPVPARPAPAPAPAERRPFSVETANHAGIDPGERLPVTPLPPPPQGAPALAAATQQPAPEPRRVRPAAAPAAVAPVPAAPEPTVAGPKAEPAPRSSNVLAPARPAGEAQPVAELPAPGAAGEQLSRSPAPTPGDAGLPPQDDGPPPPPAGDAQGEYKLAFSLYQSGKLQQARQVFERFTRLYPKHDLTDNSYYWMGEISYKEKRFEEALELFGTVIETYPTGNKVPDAFLKIGLCYINLGKEDAARKILQQVQTIFPESPAAQIASSHLKLL